MFAAEEQAIPNCNCHDLPKRWVKDSRYRGNGFWRCRREDPVKVYLKSARAATKRKESRVRQYQNKA